MDEINDYLHFTGPARRDKALHSLIGILRGITADETVNEAERRELRDWLAMNSRHAEKCPAFRELLDAASMAIADGVITAEEQLDLLALCSRLESHSEYYDAGTQAVQQLHGRLHGVIADGQVSVAEADGLLAWLTEFNGLRGCWPFTEIEAHLVSALADRQISPEDQTALLRFFDQFSELSTDSPVRKMLELTPKQLVVGGVCAVDPDIVFPDHTFCFTGLSRRASRSECHARVGAKGGRCAQNVSDELNYLVICAEGNPCWAYSCYGRKVEEAMRRRRERGQDICLVHEVDFWDAAG